MGIRDGFVTLKLSPRPFTPPQELAQLADGRPLLLAGLFLPVLGWVAFNIAGPAFRQLNGMLGNDAPAGKTKKR